MRSSLRLLYTYFETLPDRLYPFACEIEGKWVRGQRSYRHALERAFETYGPNRLGYKLIAYRALCHLCGSAVFLACVAVLTHSLLGSDSALYIIVCVAILLLTIQEFYLHPKQYGQVTSKGITDWFSWVVPIILYLTFTIPS